MDCLVKFFLRSLLIKSLVYDPSTVDLQFLVVRPALDPVNEGCPLVFVLR